MKRSPSVPDFDDNEAPTKPMPSTRFPATDTVSSGARLRYPSDEALAPPPPPPPPRRSSAPVIEAATPGRLPPPLPVPKRTGGTPVPFAPPSYFPPARAADPSSTRKLTPLKILAAGGAAMTRSGLSARASAPSLEAPPLAPPLDDEDDSDRQATTIIPRRRRWERRYKALLFVAVLVVAASGLWLAYRLAVSRAAHPTKTAAPVRNVPKAAPPAPASAPPAPSRAPAPPPTTRSAAESPIPADMGMLKTEGIARGHRIYVGDRVVGETPQSVLVACGTSSVRIGRSGPSRSIDIPCGQEVTVDHR